MIALFALLTPAAPAADLHPKPLATYEKYIRLTDQRFARDVQKPIAVKPAEGAVQIMRLHTVDDQGRRIEADDGLIHHWKGAVFIPGTSLDAVLKLVQDYNKHSRYFSEVEKSRLERRDGETFRIFYRLKRTKVITAVYNTSHTVVYTRHAPDRVSSRGFSTRIAELENPGAAGETEKPVGNDSGYLWRLNSYWRFEERDGGVIVEVESVSLSRDIPFGFAWLVKGFVESVPRESLAGTLNSIRKAAKA